ncbi:hypothetical protein OG552_05230 [Streptomyces sp. NBC_01476]|uniref:hypothetical protein n=1 Tax=Streptomyces sp. NBC_01476 TaxID=2903881 RepID=UPI002E2F4A18|nr:hypothetical protein [Streptomyces sp. NBC_01476]
MHLRPATARTIAAAALLLATTGLGALPAHATVGPPGQPYELNLATDRPATDFDHRTVDLTGVLTTADGAPVVNGSVVVSEDIVFETWNPWGDPIDPVYTESRALGTVQTDAEGRFALPGTLVDHVGDSSLAQVTHLVDFNAEYDPDGNPETYNSVYDSIRREATALPTTVTYKVSRTRVHTGDVLTVSGTVNLPPGHGSPAGTEIFLRAYWEAQYNARTTADASGRFSLSYTVRDDDGDFAVTTAPRDFYLAGVSHDLAVSHPLPMSFGSLSATVDANGLATVRTQLNQVCHQDERPVLGLQFAKAGSTAWKTVATATSDANGAVKATYQGGNGSYRWVHAESNSCLAATSAAKAVHRTEERITGFKGTPQPVRKGARLVLTGTLQYLSGSTWKHRGTEPVEIWYRTTSTSAWVRKSVVTSTTSGAFQKTVTASADGWWRAVQVGDAGSYTSTSAADWIDVR